MFKSYYDIHRKVHCITNINSLQEIYTFFNHVEYAVLEYKLKKSMDRKWKPNLLKLNNNVYSANLENYKLLSYNILAQDLLVEHLHLYYGIESKILCWENRLHNIKKEVFNIDPDILCLQEMQYNHLKELVNQFNNSNRNKKFEYVFKKKTGARSDGCVVIYDKTKFRLISEQCVEFYTVGVPTLNRENIAVMVKLQTNDGNTPFVVATTHLLYNPRREDVRISQVNKLIQAIMEFSGATNIFGRINRLPVILTGDFNFTSGTCAFEILSGLRKFKSYLDNSNDHQYADDSFQLEPIDLKFVNSASTYQDQWKTVDYILKSRSPNYMKSIKINSIYQLPSVDQCWKNGKIPNKYIGSDHFLLAVHFTII